MESVEVRVHVPAERETEFYRWFADWRDGAIAKPGRSEPASGRVSVAQTDLDRAIEWWKALKTKERAVWSLWIDSAPRMVTASAIVKSLGLKGTRDIPGILSWVKRKGERVGFGVTWRFRDDALTGEPIYGIEDAEYALLLRQARDAVEGVGGVAHGGASDDD